MTTPATEMCTTAYSLQQATADQKKNYVRGARDIYDQYYKRLHVIYTCFYVMPGMRLGYYTRAVRWVAYILPVTPCPPQCCVIAGICYY